MPPSGAAPGGRSASPSPALPEDVQARFRTDIPSPARTWNYWLGGKDNYEVDREVGDATAALNPELIRQARQGRRFLNRAVRYLATEEKIRNFLDIGAGLPTESNTHQVAQLVAPDSRVVYVDNDPMVLAHARALMRGTTPEGVTGYLDADFHNPAQILAEAANVLNFSRPIAVMFMGVLGFSPDYEATRRVVAETMAGVPSGSFLVVWDCTDTSEEARRSTEKYAESGALPYNLRSVEQIGRLFDGLEMVEPGLVSISRWRPDLVGELEPEHVHGYGAVARKP
ncbi:SAM-dependent methyltransferase [Actinomadura decatromicini]|uniref:SAM-dependent methyltransferase n=1 Tax=Actinomadura decatromicini TaxID=2604572 RepID=A0A5D3F576_9ACTN|nr:SAM-dependent methyltransferase [Actinomadura decatromicini]TYK43134.1 SAM-dependent methyltransferase [Actinomadura decatromicini]